MGTCVSMDANPAFTGTVVAIDVQSMVINSAKVNNLLSRNGVSSKQMGTPAPAFDLVFGLAFAWVSDASLWIYRPEPMCQDCFRPWLFSKKKERRTVITI